jgi:membrane protease YdiL (CAAX protease family)
MLGDLPTPIGHGFRDRPLAAATAGAIAVAVVAADLVLARPGGDFQGLRYALPAGAAAVYLLLTRGDMASLGLVLTPVQGWRFWCKSAVALAVVVGAAVVVLSVVGKLVGVSWAVPQVRPGEVGEAFWRMCVVAPLGEEATYRLVLCAPLAVLLRPWGAVAASGILFAALHWSYGNPGPDNQVAGFVLAWSYLKSGTLLVPVALHGAGNLFALATHVLAYQWGISRFP